MSASTVVEKGPQFFLPTQAVLSTWNCSHLGQRSHFQLPSMYQEKRNVQPELRHTQLRCSPWVQRQLGRAYSALARMAARGVRAAITMVPQPGASEPQKRVLSGPGGQKSRSRCQQSRAPSGGPGRVCPGFSPAPIGFLACGSITPIFTGPFCVYLCPNFPFLQEHKSCGLGHDFSLTNYT